MPNIVFSIFSGLTGLAWLVLLLLMFDRNIRKRVMRIARDYYVLAETALVGLFFVQAMRFVYATLYAHVSSASLVNLTANPATLIGLPGVVTLTQVQTELIAAGIALLAPLLAVIFGRFWFGPAVFATVVAAGRVFMTANGTTMFGVLGGIVAIGAAILYIAIIAIRRPGMVPICLLVGFAGDQLIRLYGNTADISVNTSFLLGQTIFSLILFVMAISSAIFERVLAQDEGEDPTRGEINGWSAFAFGGLLYIEFAVLGLSNTVARHAGVDYITIGPWLVVATLLPLVPEVREVARRFLGMFDGQFRGWVWYLLIGLLIVVGFRFPGILAAAALILAQLMVTLSWWWVTQPAAAKRNFTALGVVFAILLFLLLTGADFFTYEYAFVRNVAEPFGSLLRAFRGLGLVVVLFATLLSGLPAILARKRLPWRGGGDITESLAALVLVVTVGVFAASLARPVVAEPPTAKDQLRIATLNLHGGYSLYFGSDLAEIEKQVRLDGIDILLLQEVETGRMISSSIDEAAWLGRQLNMLVEYFPTNESLQGLAILSKLPIEQSEGLLLSSQGRQTGVQYIRLRAPDRAELHIYNTQLGLLLRDSTQTVQAQEQDQTQQLQEIFGFLNQNDPNSRTLIGGTFNNVPGSDIYQYMAQTFIDPFAGLQAEKAVTLKLVNGGTARVDYLWLRQITARFVGVEPVPESSHNMAIVEIGLLQSTGG